MLFGGLPFGNNEEIGLASSADGITWTAGANPVITNANSQAWASFREVPATVMYVDGVYNAWFNGDNSNLSSDPGYASGFGFATSTDGANWTMSASNPIRDEPNSPPGTALNLISVVDFDGKYEAYYTNNAPTGSTLELVTSTDGATFTGDTVVTVPVGYTLLAATTTTSKGDPLIFSVWQDVNGIDYYGVSTDGLHFAIDGTINLPSAFQTSSVLIINKSIDFFGTVDVGNINWAYGNTDIEEATAKLPTLLIGPVIDSVTAAVLPDEVFGANTVVPIDVQLNEPVTVNGTPRLNLSDGGTAIDSATASDSDIRTGSF